MRVALNAIHLVPGETGGLEIYARRLVAALEAADPAVELTVYASSRATRELAREGWRADLVPVRVDPRSRPRAVLAEQTVLPRLLRRLRPDLLHNLFNTAPARPGVTQVTTIHDLIHRRMPETHAGVLALGYRVLVPLAARRSERVIAVSGATRDDVVAYLGVADKRIDVVPNGPGSTAEAHPVPEAELRERFAVGDAPIVLSVSAKRPHKNLERLVDALAVVDDAVLVLPGYRTAFEDALRERAVAAGVAERVRITGWAQGPTLEALYAAAACFVLPSLAEGFGMPVLEAMARGVPVACSDIAVLREVAEDAAVYFDPLDATAIGGAINRLLGNPSLRDRLRAAGRERARLFSWEAAAEGTLASYRAALGR